MNKKLSNMLLACFLMQAASTSILAEETIKKEEIIKIFQEIKNQENEILHDKNNSIEIPNLSGEEITNIEKKNSMLKMISDEIKFDAPSIIHIPSSKYSVIKIGDTSKVYIASQYIDNLIMQNSYNHEARKKIFFKKRKIENIKVTSDMFKTLENEIFGQRTISGGYQQRFNNQIPSNSTTTDLLELTNGMMYKNYIVSISESFLILTHVEEINNAK